MRHFLLSRVFAEIKDFGRRSLSFADFHRECDLRNICVREAPMRRLHGVCWSDAEGTYIGINSHLYYEAKLQTAWHELGHVLLHPIERSLLASRSQWTNLDREEAEANAVAAIAIIPIIPDHHEVLSNLEELRLELFRRYGV